MKLCAKNAEERYQSGEGLLHDLEACRKSVARGFGLDDFEPGSHDVASTLRIPQKPYGREEEIASILASYERIGSEGSELLLVAGSPGVGKSTLIREAQVVVRERGGYFVTGGFNPSRRDIPYSALSEAFGALVEQLLSESSDSLESWRREISAALGANGQVVAAAIFGAHHFAIAPSRVHVMSFCFIQRILGP